MKQFAPAASEIVHKLVENEDDFDIKDVSNVGQEDYWEQICGDWGNPWIYGGSWYNRGQERILHFDGIEDKYKVEPDDIEVPAQVLAKLPPEQEDWRENHERESIIRKYQYARAEFLNARKEYPFWDIHVCKSDDYLLKRYEADMIKNTAEWAGTPYTDWAVPSKLVEIGNYIGFDEIGDKIKLSYKEAQAMLGSKNI